MSRGIPLRTCVGCRAVKDRDQLLRLVRRPDGTIEVDPQGRLPGRGAYLCWSEACLEATLKRGRLAHAFRGAAVFPAERVLAARRMISSYQYGARHGGYDDR